VWEKSSWGGDKAWIKERLNEANKALCKVVKNGCE